MKTRLISGLVVLFSGAAYAGSTPAISADAVQLAISTGTLGGKVTETVFDTGTDNPVSQLKWEIHHLAILKGDLSWDAWPFLTLNARGWTSLAAGGGFMEDNDWDALFPSEQPDRGTHPHTRVNGANEFDLNLQGWLLQGENYRVGAVLGYQQTRFSWTAVGGSWRYRNGTQTGEFPRDQNVIAYRQRFALPYIGLTGRYRLQNMELGALLKFSDRVRAQDNDEHYLRGSTYRDKVTGSRYYGLSLDAGYYLTAKTRLFTEFAYNRYAEHKGRLQIRDRRGELPPFEEQDGAGIAGKNYSVTAGVQYRF